MNISNRCAPLLTGSSHGIIIGVAPRPKSGRANSTLGITHARWGPDSAYDISEEVALIPGGKVSITFVRDGRTATVDATIKPRTIESANGQKGTIGYLGVILPHEIAKASTVLEALQWGIADGTFYVTAQITTLRQIITGQRDVQEVSGPIRIAQVSASSMTMGLAPFLSMMAMLSVAVAVMNLLPIPGMDGGHLVTYAVEFCAGRDLPDRLKQEILRVGTSLIVIVTFGTIVIDIVAIA